MKIFFIEDMYIKFELIFGVFIFYLKIYMKLIFNFYYIWYFIYIYILYYENIGNVIFNFLYLKV